MKNGHTFAEPGTKPAFHLGDQCDLRDQHDDGVMVRDRFRREAKAVASLSHPNIMAVYDFGSEGGTTFLVCELLEGETLRTRLEQGALPPRKATEFGRQIARGLADALPPRLDPEDAVRLALQHTGWTRDELDAEPGATRRLSAVIASTALTPWRPVKALELPELTRMAAPASDAPPSFAWQSSTGADRVADRVNAPAMAVPGRSLASMRSVRPW